MHHLPTMRQNECERQSRNKPARKKSEMLEPREKLHSIQAPVRRSATFNFVRIATV